MYVFVNCVKVNVINKAGRIGEGAAERQKAMVTAH